MLTFLSPLLLAIPVVFGSLSTQIPLPQANYASEPYDAGLFTPFESLDALSHDKFTTLLHPAFPKHRLRVKKSNFCDSTVAAYTGYIDIEAKHIFFYLFESRRNPAKDDVLFWVNGGPGASSAFGAFMELGPCRVINGTTVFHPQSWNEYANVFFVDQPVGVGFSYADYGETVNTTEDAAHDIANFISIFFAHFSQFKSRPLHMAGESYGGRYIPAMAAAVYDSNERLRKAGMPLINLTSIMIGNGVTHPLLFQTSVVDMQCTAASGLPPMMPVSTCVRMQQAKKRCEKWVQKSCIDVFDSFGCVAASDFCEKELLGPYFASGRNPYDVSKMCEGTAMEDACYPIAREIRDYLNKEDVRREIGIDPAFSSNFSMISMATNFAFSQNNDIFAQSYLYVRELLERGVKVLVYAGMYDLVCNWVGNEQWTRELEWTGQESFASTPLTEWTVDKKPAGLIRSAEGLTFLTVYDAGHMAPYDKPKESLEMLRKWLEDERF